MSDYPVFTKTHTNRANIKSVKTLGNSDGFSNLNVQRPVTSGVLNRFR